MVTHPNPGGGFRVNGSARRCPGRTNSARHASSATSPGRLGAQHGTRSRRRVPSSAATRWRFCHEPSCGCSSRPGSSH